MRPSYTDSFWNRTVLSNWCFIFIILTTSFLLLSGCGNSQNKQVTTSEHSTGRLNGAAESIALNSIVSIKPQAAKSQDIQNGVILTRLDVVLDLNATVGEVNDALDKIGAKIVTSQPKSPIVTLELPRQANSTQLADIADQLAKLPGIVTAFTGKEAQTRAIPDFANANPPVDSQSIDFLQNSKFPAAWNAGGLLNECVADPVNLIIVDKFGSLSSMGAAMQARIAKEFPQYTLKGSVLDDGETHGWNVAAIAAAEFSASESTGAMPFSGCLNLTLLSVSGLTYAQQLVEIATYLSTLGSEPAILNYSLGFKDRCDTACTAASVADGSKLDEFKNITTSSERAWMALAWKLSTHNFWNQLVIVTAAGDEAGQELTQTYHALGIARYNSALSYVTDSDFIASTQTNWGTDTDPGAKFIQTDSTELAKLRNMENFLASVGVDTTAAHNVIIVGQGEGSPSDSGVDVDIPAQKIPDLSGNSLISGSSFAAPQVSGLAAFMWALDGIGLRDAIDILNTSPVIHAIVNSATIDTTTGEHKLDALAALLSLDSDASSEPPAATVRAAMLDFNDDGVFNQDDITLFANVANLSTAPDPFTQSTEVAFNRLNLHGMGGLSGVLASGKFDLDVENSNYLGAAKYGTVPLKIGATTINLDENNLSNTEILCYYAYSPLYLGDQATLDNLLPVSVCSGKINNPSFAFTSFDSSTNQFDIYTMDEDGSNLINLTGTGNQYKPDISPDGSKIVYADNSNNNEEIYVMNIDGSGKKNLTQSSGAEGDPLWSPDGSKIAFIGNDDSIYIMDADGTNRVSLGTPVNQAWAWSPDGTKIAFATRNIFNNGIARIHTVAVDGSGQNIVIESASNSTINYVAVSPDSSQIAYGNGTSIYKVSVNGGTEIKLTPDYNPPSFTVYVEGDPTWSADGTKLIFVSDRSVNYKSEKGLFVMNSDGSNQTLLVSQPYIPGGALKWSTDGLKIAYLLKDHITFKTQIHLMNVDGTGDIQLSPIVAASNFSWFH